MTVPTDYQNAELWIRELTAAGWTPKTPTIWKAPSGSLHLGPYGAWKTMRALKEYDPFTKLP